MGSRWTNVGGAGRFRAGSAIAPWPEPDEALEHAELVETIEALPQEFREALVAVDVVGLSYREAARLLGTREGTITTRVFRARQRVARTLGRCTTC
jgi:RNA polymerase sigma-70 factor (ECF subfamily)